MSDTQEQEGGFAQSIADLHVVQLGQLPLDCHCFLRSNFFVGEVGGTRLNKHFAFSEEANFRSVHAEWLRSRRVGLDDEVVALIVKERARRAGMDEAADQRKAAVCQLYTPLRQDVYQLQSSCFDPSFVQLVEEAKSCSRKAQLIENTAIKELARDIYVLPMLTTQFCTSLLEELAHFGATCSGIKGQPNSMNKHGVLLDEMGMTDSFTNPLIAQFLLPLTAILFPDDGGGALDNHRCFSVQYAIGEDVALSTHYDNAEVTLNVGLGGSYSGGGLEFTGDKYGAPGSRRSPPVVHEHQVGLAVLHRGAEMHCARAIEGDIGTRTNLIVWMRSTQWRRHNGCAMCGQVEGLLGHSKPPKRAAAAAAAPPPADGGESACCMPS
jgi:hypothetical protein